VESMVCVRGLEVVGKWEGPWVFSYSAYGWYSISCLVRRLFLAMTRCVPCLRDGKCKMNYGDVTE